MFKALNIRDNTEVVIIDPKWIRAINQLREYGRQNILVCQGCNQPVRVRAGDQRREHFAHKHKESCDYADESAILRNSRAVLYEFLKNKFGENVTIEKKVDGIDLFRPIDCWVKKDSAVFAYWIFDSTLKPEKRIALQNSVRELDIHINWVFASNLLHFEQNHPDNLVLSTTEREFIHHSQYDTPYADSYSTEYGSLHYLDADNRELLTFRGLSLFHKPQIYNGFNLMSDLEKVLVFPKNGEFVHNGEHDKLQEYENNLIKAESATKLLKSFSSHRNSDIINPLLKCDDNKDSLEANSEVSVNKTGKCVFCGEITDDWLTYNGKTGLCKCMSCKMQGKF